MNIIERFRARQEERKLRAKGLIPASEMSRKERRQRGHRGRLYAGMVSRAPTFVPRYIRRHHTEVMAQPFTWRVAPWAQGRRERKVRARINRLVAKYDLSAPI